MKIYENPARNTWEAICRRPTADDPLVRERVEKIIGRVRADGDRALRELSTEIDGRCPEHFEVSREEIEEAAARVSEAVREAIRNAAENIRRFHAAQLPREIRVETAPGVLCVQRPVPIRRVGLYIPGGSAPLFSTVLMLAIPARLAGCAEIILCSPTGKDGKIAPEVLFAADFCGVGRIFKLGGAQAVAAMALGTQSVPRVDKIFGPGNRYVTTAKQLLGGREVAIDMPAGPSEVMVIADGSARADYVAADMLSQAEHGPDSQVMLVCTEADFARRVEEELARQIPLLGRSPIAVKALEGSCSVVLPEQADICAFADCYAPEHLIIATARPWEIADRISAAGSVFIGNYTPESAGDYASGTNHTLPTCGWARSQSGVNMDSFLRKMTLQEITPAGLKGLAPTLVEMASAEGLQAHANAVIIRTEDESK
ncbi:MAG: histidinol dehydrogenase [Bacteroidales bacterium]|nr:histidinol dehydrogenase [Bacteroidales bacterium]